MSKKFSFETPINSGKKLHGMLTVSGTHDSGDVEIDSIMYKQNGSSSNTNITELIYMNAFSYWETLCEMAINHCTPDAIDEDYTIAQSDNY
jgi:hypothetical protein